MELCLSLDVFRFLLQDRLVLVMAILLACYFFLHFLPLDISNCNWIKNNRVAKRKKNKDKFKDYHNNEYYDPNEIRALDRLYISSESDPLSRPILHELDRRIVSNHGRKKADYLGIHKSNYYDNYLDHINRCIKAVEVVVSIFVSAVFDCTLSYSFMYLFLILISMMAIFEWLYYKWRNSSEN